MIVFYYMFHEILGVRIDDLSTEDLKQKLADWTQGPPAKIIVTPNPEMIVLAQSDHAFRDLLNRADLALPDGVGLRYATWALSTTTLVHRHPGADLVWILAEIASQGGLRLGIVGATALHARSAIQAAAQFKNRYPNLDVRVYDPERVTADGSMTATNLEEIQRDPPAIILVALGQKKQERWIERYRDELPSVRLFAGIGGALDMVAGALPRAPVWMRRAGLEWLWRWGLEPKRTPRMLRALVVFPTLVLLERFKK